MFGYCRRAESGVDEPARQRHRRDAGGRADSASRLEKDDGAVAVRIIDNGGGIPDEIREKIFEPFYTTKPLGEGTGLGLDIVQRIVTQQHAGQITVTSKPGETIFTVLTSGDAAVLAGRERYSGGRTCWYETCRCMLNADRYFSPIPAVRISRGVLYERVASLPLVCPHGHVDPRMLAENAPFPGSGRAAGDSRSLR